MLVNQKIAPPYQGDMRNNIVGFYIWTCCECLQLSA